MQTALTAAKRALLDGAFDPSLRDGGLGAVIAGLIGSQVEDSGRRAINVLRLAANVASTEAVTIGVDVYEINIVNTDTTVNVSGGELATGTPDVSNITIAAHGLAAGDLIRVDNEIMKVLGAPSANVVVVRRGHSGTTIATHADAADIFKAGTPATAGRLEVGLVTTLTPTVAGVALAAVINMDGIEAVTATVISASEVLLTADAIGPVVTACTETLAGSNNVWAAAAMFGGRALGQRRVSLQQRVPTATEVALGNLHFVFDFAPVTVSVRVVPTATPGAAKAWDGAITITGNRAVVDNAGSTDWAATDTVQVFVTD
ncbi:MAG: hypothetical protein ABI629_10405 [bacterium]